MGRRQTYSYRLRYKDDIDIENIDGLFETTNLTFVTLQNIDETVS